MVKESIAGCPEDASLAPEAQNAKMLRFRSGADPEGSSMSIQRRFDRRRSDVDFISLHHWGGLLPWLVSIIVERKLYWEKLSSYKFIQPIH